MYICICIYLFHFDLHSDRNTGPLNINNYAIRQNLLLSSFDIDCICRLYMRFFFLKCMIFFYMRDVNNAIAHIKIKLVSLFKLQLNLIIKY